MRSRTIDLFVDGKQVASSGDVNRFPNDLRPKAPLRLGARSTADGGPGAPLAGGELLTKPLRFSGARLEINFSTSAAGVVRVEVLSPDGQPLLDALTKAVA